MKRLITVFLSLAIAIPALAAPARKFKDGSESKPQLLASQPGRLARILDSYNAYRNGPGAAAIGDLRSTRMLVFPAAGNARGAGGEFFRSDVTLVSFNPTAPQKVIAIWFQNGVTTNDPPFLQMTLEPNTYYTFRDFVGVTLQRQNQLGSIVVVPVDAAGSVDFSGAALDGFSRIWTNQPNATGTVAQPFEAIDPYSMYVFETASILGLRHDAQYRSNYGVVNVDDVPHTFSIRFLGENAQSSLTVTVPAGGMIHQAVPSASYGALVIEVDVDDPEAPWIAYGTTNDNITGDGWVSIGGAIFTPDDLDDIDGGF